ncbi:hypothetical protein BKA01_004227 [Pseudonocardia eucalypti]|nr:hypothetical protein [Pseudonocardia eucalypti]
MNEPALFDDDAVTGIPVRGDEYVRKMPGHGDAQGDHCNTDS